MYIMPHGFLIKDRLPPWSTEKLTLLKASVRPSASKEASSNARRLSGVSAWKYWNLPTIVLQLKFCACDSSLKWSGAIGHGWAVGFDNIEPLRNLGGGELLRIAVAKDFIVKRYLTSTK